MSGKKLWYKSVAKVDQRMRPPQKTLAREDDSLRNRKMSLSVGPESYNAFDPPQVGDWVSLTSDYVDRGETWQHPPACAAAAREEGMKNGRAEQLNKKVEDLTSEELEGLPSTFLKPEKLSPWPAIFRKRELAFITKRPKLQEFRNALLQIINERAFEDLEDAFDNAKGWDD